MAAWQIVRSTTLIVIATCTFAVAQHRPSAYPLTRFDNTGCSAKGRVQDCDGAVMRSILRDGKNAIPVLISQLTENTGMKEPIEDYWVKMTTGDVAFIVLTDLFTEPDYRTFNMPDVPDWKAIETECEDKASQPCWYEYVRKHGRMSVRQAWSRAWQLRKNQITWDANANCFRVSKK